MTGKRVLSLLLSLVLTVCIFPLSGSAGEKNILRYEVSDDLNEKNPSVGDVFTVTLSVTENPGFNVGSFFFRISDNLSVVSATCFGEPCNILTGENPDLETYGDHGIYYISLTPLTHTGEFCAVTLSADAEGEASVRAYGYDLSLAIDTVDTASEKDTVSLTVLPPDPPVITTEALPDGVLGKAYSFALTADPAEDVTWDATGLPAGLSMLNDGTISGTPTECGDFSVTVTATLLGEYLSEPVQFSLHIEEKPRTISLKNGTGYTVNADDRLITGVLPETTLSSLLDCLSDTDGIKIYNGSGKEITEADAFIGNGTVIRLEDASGTTVDELKIIIKGDIDGNGTIGSHDYIVLRAYLMERKTIELSENALLAAHISGAEEIGSRDYILLRAHLMDLLDIYA